MATIDITKGYKVIVDDEDLLQLKEHRWTVMERGKYTPYAIRSQKINGKYKTIYMHREIMRHPEGLCIDHINGDGLDNRKANLRVCTVAENQRNRPEHRQKPKYLGTAIRRYGNRIYYVAQTRENGTTKYLGMSKTRDGAKAIRTAYDNNLI